MRRYLFIVLVVISTFTQFVKGQTKEEIFGRGVELFTAGDTQGALDQWITIYNQGYRSAGLCYNIGNAYFKLNRIPESILFYERGLLLKPGDEDIEYNLAIARTFVVDKFEEIPVLFFVNWYNFISLSLSTNTWAVISIITFLFFLILISFFIYSSKFKLKVTSFWSALIFVLISVLSLSFSVRNRELVYNSGKAIILNPVVNGKSSPDNSGTDLFVLHEGTKVTIEDTLGDWAEVRLSDGNKGWITTDCLDKI